MPLRDGPDPISRGSDEPPIFLNFSTVRDPDGRRHGHKQRATPFRTDGMSGVSCLDGERVRQQLYDRQLARERCGDLLLRQRIELWERLELGQPEQRWRVELWRFGWRLHLEFGHFDGLRFEQWGDLDRGLRRER